MLYSCTSGWGGLWKDLSAPGWEETEDPGDCLTTNSESEHSLLPPDSNGIGWTLQKNYEKYNNQESVDLISERRCAIITNLLF